MAEVKKVWKPTAAEVAAILADHELWLLGTDGKRADLRYADLRSANLRSANLRYANLSSADLRSANLRYANLRYANLSSADLSYADLRYANLSYADLRSADLSDANLSYANLIESRIEKAKNAELILARTEIVPREGEVIGWKKCQDNVIVKLRVPPEAKRSNALGRKCRAEFVEVLQVCGGKVGLSLHDSVTKYQKGKIVKADKWAPNRLVECGGGIHFYLTREEAENHS